MITRPGPLAVAVAALVAVFLLMPLIAVIPVSFTTNRYLSLPDGEWSWRHYQALIENPAWVKGLGLSVGIGVVSSVLATSSSSSVRCSFSFCSHLTSSSLDINRFVSS